MLRKINNLLKEASEEGSMMIEALAMLGLISMVTPVIYKKAAERTTEMQDVNAAGQIRTIVKSVDDYLRDNYSKIINKSTVGGTNYSGLTDTKPVTLSLTDTELVKYLPIGFKTNGKTFSGFDLAINQKTTGTRKTLTAVMVANTQNTDTFTQMRSSRIASMIGTNGGYVDGANATGVQGVWQIPKNKLPNNAAPNNTIVATSLQAIADGTAGGDNVLHRKVIAGRPELNTMETAINMNNNNLTQVNDLIANTTDNTIGMQGTGTNNLILNVKGKADVATSFSVATDKFTVNSGGSTKIAGTTTGYGNLQIGTGGSNYFNVMAADGSMSAATGKMTVDKDGNTLIKGTTTGHGNLQIGAGGSNKFNVMAADGSMSAATGNMTVDKVGNTLIKGTTTGHGNLQIGTGGSNKFNVMAADGSMSAATGKMTVSGGGALEAQGYGKIWGDFQVGSNTAKTASANNFFVTGTTGAVRAAAGNMTVDASGNTVIKGTTTGYNDLKIMQISGSGSTAITGTVLTVDAGGAKTSAAAADGTYIRKGVILLPRSASATSAASTGYIKADRLIGNVAALDEQEGNYKEYQVNPAYTSMMHDIKLTSRGGARLSDVLPDFINKGIYVLDNTYKGDANWETATLKDVSGGGYTLNGLDNCTNVKCDSSPWLGFIPAPNCPDGYMKVATIAPIRFNMAQAGIPVKDSSMGWGVGQHHDPRGEYKNDGTEGKTVSQTEVLVYPDDGSVNKFPDGSSSSTNFGARVINSPYNFQVSTWLNTTIKAYKPTSGFKGWHGIMGFIYPAADYKDYLTGIGKTPKCGIPPKNCTDDELNSTIIWNLFPVYKEELSAIATVYCYFKRDNFNTSLVDQYQAHKNTIDDIRDNSKLATDKAVIRQNDPNITDYKNSLW